MRPLAYRGTGCRGNCSLRECRTLNGAGETSADGEWARDVANPTRLRETRSLGYAAWPHPVDGIRRAGGRYTLWLHLMNVSSRRLRPTVDTRPHGRANGFAPSCPANIAGSGGGYEEGDSPCGGARPSGGSPRTRATRSSQRAHKASLRAIASVRHPTRFDAGRRCGSAISFRRYREYQCARRRIPSPRQAAA